MHDGTATTSAIRLYVIDPHPITRVGLDRLFRSESDVRVVGEAPTAAALLSGAVPPPDVVLSDMATRRQLADAEMLLARHRSLTIVAFTERRCEDLVRGFIAAGGVGWTLKDEPLDGVRRAVRLAAEGRTFFDPAIADSLVQPSPNRLLSGRELVVLRMIARGAPQKVIAAALGVKDRTVETYRARGLSKLHLTTRRELVRHAVGAGWLECGDASEHGPRHETTQGG